MTIVCTVLEVIEVDMLGSADESHYCQDQNYSGSGKIFPGINF